MAEYIKQIPNSNFWITITGNIYKVTNLEVINVQRYVKMGENFTPSLLHAKFDFELTNGIICKNAYVCVFIKKLFPENLFCMFLPNLNLNRDVFEEVVNYLNTNFGIIPMEELLITAESFTLIAFTAQNQNADFTGAFNTLQQLNKSLSVGWNNVSWTTNLITATNGYYIIPLCFSSFHPSCIFKDFSIQLMDN